MNYSFDEIKELLLKFKILKLRSNVFKNIISNEDVRLFDFLIKCIESLDAESKVIIYNIYKEKKSVRKCAEELGMSKTTCQNLKNQAIENIQYCLNEILINS